MHPLANKCQPNCDGTCAACRYCEQYDCQHDAVERPDYDDIMHNMDKMSHSQRRDCFDAHTKYWKVHDDGLLPLTGKGQVKDKGPTITYAPRRTTITKGELVNVHGSLWSVDLITLEEGAIRVQLVHYIAKGDVDAQTSR